MALTLVTPAANESRLHGVMDYASMGGFPLEGYSRFMAVHINVDLENTAYETGGIPLPKEITGLQRVLQMYVLAGPDPYSQGDAAPPNGLTFTLDATDPEAPLLVISDVSGELADTTTQAADVSVWLLLGGID